MRILITGASGMLGQDVSRVFSDAGHEIVATDRHDLDITNRDQVLSKIGEIAPDAIINTAAYNFVDKVEEADVYPIAYAINAEGPRNLAEAAKQQGIPFVHYSTDYVFAGDKPEGYTEDDAPQPISKYGETKLASELLAREMGGKVYICRLSKLFGKPGIGQDCKESFASLMLRLAKEKPELKIVNEEVGCPTYTPDVAAATYNLLTSKMEPGIYHMINEGAGVTWYEFAKEIFDLAGVKTPFLPVSSADFPKPAARPKFAALKNTKLPKLRARVDALRDFLLGQI